MTMDGPVNTGRFGAATPGVRPSPPSLEALLAAPQPPPGRSRWTRRRILMLVGIVVVAAVGYAAGHFTWPHAPPPRPTELVVTDRALPAGFRLAQADFRAVPVQAGASGPTGAMTPAAAASLVGMVTARAIPAGTFLERSLLTNAGAMPNNAHALVGLALKPGQLPVGGLSVGQQVLVVMLRASSAGTVLHAVPLVITSVWDMQGPDSSGATLATVLVPAHEAVLLSSYAAQGDVALVATAITKTPRPTAPSVTPSATPTPAAKATPKPTPHPSHTTKAKTGR